MCLILAYPPFIIKYKNVILSSFFLLGLPGGTRHDVTEATTANKQLTVNSYSVEIPHRI